MGLIPFEQNLSGEDDDTERKNFEIKKRSIRFEAASLGRWEKGVKKKMQHGAFWTSNVSPDFSNLTRCLSYPFATTRIL